MSKVPNTTPFPPGFFDTLPAHMIPSFRQYIEHHVMPDPSSFLYAVLTNDLKESFVRADHVNLAHMKNIVVFLYSKMPVEAWGDRDRVKRWVLRGPANVTDDHRKMDSPGLDRLEDEDHEP
jgi:hypothetical protein